MDNEWIFAGLGFLIGMCLLGLVTSIAVLIDIKMDLTAEKRKRGFRRSREDVE